MKINHFLAFDLGATSGRTILGTLCDGKLEIKEEEAVATRVIFAQYVNTQIVCYVSGIIITGTSFLCTNL